MRKRNLEETEMEEQVREVPGYLEEEYDRRIRAWWNRVNPGLTYRPEYAIKLYWQELLD
jgi:hypothetical protein